MRFSSGAIWPLYVKRGVRAFSTGDYGLNYTIGSRIARRAVDIRSLDETTERLQINFMDERMNLSESPLSRMSLGSVSFVQATKWKRQRANER